jgi:hypothetical protein
LLKKLGLSPQKPLRRAYQQNPEAVDRWVNEKYPKIRKLAKLLSSTLAGACVVMTCWLDFLLITGRVHFKTT